MKIKNVLFSILFFIGVLAFVTQCHKPEKVDPCKDQYSFEADFDILEEVGDTLIVTDTVLPNTVVFRASGKYDSYEWSLSGDELKRVWTTQSFKLDFDQPYGMIEATLIAHKKPNTNCFPDDNGIDTLTKKFWVVSPTYAKIAGEYEGALEEFPEDKFTVKIAYDYVEKMYKIYNINQGCKNLNFGDLNERWGYMALKFKGDEWYGDGCRGPHGYAVLQDNRNEILISFSIGDISKPFGSKGYPKLYYTFKGMRTK